MTGLALPLSAEDNRPIKDAAGQIVSIPEHAAAFAHAMNMHKRLIDLLAATQIPLLNSTVCLPPGNARLNNQRLLDEIKRVVIEARVGARLKPVEEVDETTITDVLAEAYDVNAPSASVLAKAVKTKFRVYSR